MAKQINLLKNGIFSKPFMDSKITTEHVTKKELIFGHLLGPLGMIFVINTIAGVVEKFFTQQTAAMYGAENVAMIQAMGGKYEIVVTIAKIIAVGIGLLNSWLISHGQSKQGRFRPWYLIFSLIGIAIGFLIFLFPGNKFGESYWYYFFLLLICFNTIGSSFFYLYRDMIVSVSTRDSYEKRKLAFTRKVTWTLISGIVIGLVFNSILMPMWLEKDIHAYAVLMVIVSTAAIPLLLLEYYYTKERVIEDVAAEKGIENENRIPLKSQMKALLTNKYFVILTILTMLNGCVDSFKGGNVQYFYIKFMLGGMDNPMMYTIYQILTGFPTGIGALIAYPIAKKVGIKNMTFAGYAMVLVGSIIGWIAPSNMPVAMVAGFLRNVGMIPNAYVFVTLLLYAYDDIEFRSGLRLEGLIGVGIIGALTNIIQAPFAGGYESNILTLGFVDAPGIIPSDAVKNFMTMSFYLLDIVLSSAYLILLPFVNVEKKLPEINEELLRRRKEAAIAAGEEWIDPEEKARQEKEEEQQAKEKARIAALKEKCLRKGLDFEKENAKYLEKKAEKEAKKVDKSGKK